MYPFSPKFSSHPGCHVTLSRVPCASIALFKNFFLSSSLFFKKYYWFVWLFLVLFAVCRIFSCSIWDLISWPEIEPETLHLELGASATGPPRKSLNLFIYLFIWSIVDLQCCIIYCYTTKWLSVHVCVNIYVYICIICIYVYMYTYVYIYICIYIFTHTHTFFYFLFHHGLPRDIEYSSLCCTVVPCCLSIVLILLSTWLFWLNREEDRELREQKSLTSPLLP